MARFLKIRRLAAGFTMVELIIALVIVAILCTVTVVTLSGLQKKDDVDRATQMIYDDLIFIRSQAISLNSDHRINFLSTTQWRIEAYNSATSTWNATSATRSMPTNTYLTSDSAANASTNLNATPRGLFTFLNGAQGLPYVSITALGVSKIKNINVAVGGAVEIKTL
ncbi:MAG: type II secretion system protein [Pseudomonadota bacterium]